MSIHEIVWSEGRIEHIVRHNVSPKEVEKVYFSRSLLLKAKSQGEKPVYYVLGQTRSGRYLFCVIIRFPGGKRYPVTARPMTDKENPDTDEPVFTGRDMVMEIRFSSDEAEKVRKIAKFQGIGVADLIHE